MKKILLSAISTLLFFNLSFGGVPTDQAQAMFMYNFTRLVNWPGNSGAEFVIGVIGDASLSQTLQGFLGTKKVNGKPVKVALYNTIDEIAECHMLFIGESMSGSISTINSKVSAFNTLIVGEQAGLTNQGAAISFVMNGGKLNFELNESNATKYNLTVSSALVTMAMNSR